MRQQNKDLLLILLIAVMNIVWVYFPTHFVVVGIILALPLMFLVPGYLLIEILAQKRRHDGATHLLLSIGLSLSIDILCGFLLNIIPAGLTPITWGVFLAVLSMICTLLCMVRRRQWQVHVDQKLKDLPTRYEFLLLTLIVYVVIFVFIYITSNTENKSYQGFTQFWLLLDNHRSHNCVIQLGIESSETVTTAYQVEVKENNRYAARWSSITLAPQQQWQGRLLIAINHTQTPLLQIEADLYRQREPGSVYRTAHLFLAKSTCAQNLSISSHVRVNPVMVHELETHDATWLYYFSAHNICPYIVFYEKFVEHYQETVFDIICPCTRRGSIRPQTPAKTGRR